MGHSAYIKGARAPEIVESMSHMFNGSQSTAMAVMVILFFPRVMMDMSLLALSLFTAPRRDPE